MQADRAAANGIILCLRFQSAGARKWKADRDNPLPLTLQ